MFSRFRNQLTGRVHAMLFPESKVLEKNFPIFVPASWNASESESLTIILSGASFLRERGKNTLLERRNTYVTMETKDDEYRNSFRKICW